jgi:CRP-like cAMP-binding protein
VITKKRLRRYSFFKLLNDEQLSVITKLAEVEKIVKEDTLFEEGMPAETLYFLLEGRVELYHMVIAAYHPQDRIESKVCTIEPGELFSISALIEPRVLTSTARVIKSGEILKLNATALETSLNEDMELAHVVMRQIAKAVMTRLNATRVQLAKAWELVQT